MRRVLIVDDDTDSSESTAILLRLEGHEVLTLREGHSALAAVRTFAPDAVLLDIGLPDIDGYELARRLRRSGCSARLVAVTGYGRAEDVERAREAEFDDHCLKPVERFPTEKGDVMRILVDEAASDTDESAEAEYPDECLLTVFLRILAAFGLLALAFVALAVAAVV